MISGAELAIADFVAGADGQFDYIMLTPGEGSLSDYYRKRGFEVWTHRLETRRRKYPGLHSLQSYIFARLLREKKIDVVLCNTFAAASRSRTACRLARIPYAIYVREYISDKAIHRQILAEADKIYVVSHDLKNHLSPMVDPTKVLVAYDPIDAHQIVERVKAHRASGVRLVPFGLVHPIVGMVGRITPFKQQDLFVRAAAAVLSTIPEARFVVAGAAQEAEKDYEAYVFELAKSLKVQDKIAFLGQRPDAIEVMSEFTVACLASSREPLGRVILEAHLIGLPVIVPNTGGAAETVEDGATGLVFHATGPDATNQLADRIVRLLKDAGLRNALAAKAKLKIEDTFAGQQHIRQLEQYLQALSGEKAVAHRGR